MKIREQIFKQNVSLKQERTRFGNVTWLWFIKEDKHWMNVVLSAQKTVNLVNYKLVTGEGGVASGVWPDDAQRDLNTRCTSCSSLFWVLCLFSRIPNGIWSTDESGSFESHIHSLGSWGAMELSLPTSVQKDDDKDILERCLREAAAAAAAAVGSRRSDITTRTHADTDVHDEQAFVESGKCSPPEFRPVRPPAPVPPGRALWLRQKHQSDQQLHVPAPNEPTTRAARSREHTLEYRKYTSVPVGWYSDTTAPPPLPGWRRSSEKEKTLISS